MKPTGFAKQFFQKPREENSNLTGTLGINKEHFPTLFCKTSITLIWKPRRKKYKKVKSQTLSIDEMILNKTLTNKSLTEGEYMEIRLGLLENHKMF